MPICFVGRSAANGSDVCNVKCSIYFNASLDTAIFEFVQDGLVTEAEFNAQMLASSPPFL